jgi:hypothetical protein
MSDDPRYDLLVRELANEKQHQEVLEKELEALKQQFHNYVLEQQKTESRRLRTALIWAGGVILALSGFMFSEIIWPAIKAVGITVKR